MFRLAQSVLVVAFLSTEAILGPSETYVLNECIPEVTNCTKSGVVFAKIPPPEEAEDICKSEWMMNSISPEDRRRRLLLLVFAGNIGNQKVWIGNQSVQEISKRFFKFAPIEERYKAILQDNWMKLRKALRDEMGPSLAILPDRIMRNQKLLDKWLEILKDGQWKWNGPICKNP